MADKYLSAVEKAKLVAAKITGQLSDGGSGGGGGGNIGLSGGGSGVGFSGKRHADSSDESSSKKFASLNDAVGAQLAMFKAQHLGGAGAVVEEYKVPEKFVGLVIGRGGEQIQRILAETQCKVQMVPGDLPPGVTEKTFTLTGTKEAVDRARRFIDELLKKTSSNDSSRNGNFDSIDISLPANKCGLVIGKGGETIKRLSEQYGVKMVVVQQTSAVTGTDKPLRISGDPEKVAKAKEAVMQLINSQTKTPGGGHHHSTNEYGSKPQHSGVNEALIKIPGDKAGIVIGKGGESVKDINRRSGAHVEIDKSQRNSTDHSTDKMFIIRGTNEQIQFAQQLIYEKITGVQGSQPPQGYFNNANEMSPYDAARGDPNASGYSAAQAWGNPYQTNAADPTAAWAAYYQSYYGQAATGGQPVAAASAAPAAPGQPSSQPSINPQTGQPDYSQAWIEYYRSLGMHDQADAILRQTQQGQTNGSATASTAAPSAVPQQQQQPTSAASNASSSSSANPAAPPAQQNGNSSNPYANQWPGYSAYHNYGYNYGKQEASSSS